MLEDDARFSTDPAGATPVFRTTVRLVAVFGGSGVAAFAVVVAVAVLARVVRVGAGAAVPVPAGFDLADALVMAGGFVDMLCGFDELEMSA